MDRGAWRAGAGHPPASGPSAGCSRCRSARIGNSSSSSSPLPMDAAAVAPPTARTPVFRNTYMELVEARSATLGYHWRHCRPLRWPSHGRHAPPAIRCRGLSGCIALGLPVLPPTPLPPHPHHTPPPPPPLTRCTAKLGQCGTASRFLLRAASGSSSSESELFGDENRLATAPAVSLRPCCRDTLQR